MDNTDFYRELAVELVDEFTADTDKTKGHIGVVQRYLRGDHDMPYLPRNARSEYRQMAKSAITNWLPLITRTFSQGLKVSGYRWGSQYGTGLNMLAWDWWQANGLDARQSITHCGALNYGAAYVLVLPGEDGMPVIKPLDPTRSYAWFADPDDEHPEYGLRQVGVTREGAREFELYTPDEVFDVYVPPAKAGSTPVLSLSDPREHSMGVVPFVRFRESLDGESRGLIAPSIPLQHRLNEIVLMTAMAMHYSSFRQKWATGLEVPTDDEGRPVEPFNAAVNRMFVSDSPDTKFGDFAQTELSGHHQAYMHAVKTLAATHQISPNIFVGDLVNLSGDAIAQMEQGTQRRLASYETNFGESWEAVFRLAGRAAGNEATASDMSAQVLWADSEARSLSATVDALGKMRQMLDVPVEALWAQLPGVSHQDVQSWAQKYRASDPIAAIADEMARHAAPGADSSLTAMPSPEAA